MATYESQVNKLVGEEHPAADVTEWMVEGLQTIVNVLPEDMLWMLEANTKEYSEADAVHGVAVGTNKILYVQRLSDSNLTDTDGDGVADVKMLVECREVPASLRGRVKAGSGWKEESSETDPVWYKLGKRIYVEPAPTDYISSGSEFGAVANLSKATGSTSFEPYGTYSSTGAQGYEVEVISPVEGVDMFKWSKGTSLQSPNLAMNAVKQYEFAASNDGWTNVAATEDVTTDLQLTSTGGTVQLYNPGGLSIDGSKNRYIKIRVKTTDNTITTENWYGRLYYKTSTQSTYSEWIQFTPSSTGVYENITLDMHQGVNVGTSWISSTIVDFKFQIFQSVAKSSITCSYTNNSSTVGTADASLVEVGDTVDDVASIISASTVQSVDTGNNTFVINSTATSTANATTSIISNGVGDVFNISHFIVGGDDDNGVKTVGTPSTNSVHATQPWTAATYNAVNHTDNSSGSGATFDVVVDSEGDATVTVKNYGKGYAVDKTFTVTGDTLGNASADDLTFSVTSLHRPEGNDFGDGVFVRWVDGNANHTVGDKYEFSAEPSNRSKVYYISNPPSGWQFNSTYLDGTIPKEIDPIVLNYVSARALEQKLADIQNGSSASLEQYIIDEDIDLAQAQQILIQDTHALIDRYTKEYQMGIQGLITGTYAPQSTGGEKQQPAYSNVAQ